jgi:hypothetical protein
MQLLTHFVAAEAIGALGAGTLLSASPIAPAPHSHEASGDHAAKRTAWNYAFGAAATWSPIG